LLKEFIERDGVFVADVDEIRGTLVGDVEIVAIEGIIKLDYTTVHIVIEAVKEVWCVSDTPGDEICR